MEGRYQDKFDGMFVNTKCSMKLYEGSCCLNTNRSFSVVLSEWYKGAIVAVSHVEDSWDVVLLRSTLLHVASGNHEFEWDNRTLGALALICALLSCSESIG